MAMASGGVPLYNPNEGQQQSMSAVGVADQQQEQQGILPVDQIIQSNVAPEELLQQGPPTNLQAPPVVVVTNNQERNDEQAQNPEQMTQPDEAHEG